MSSSGDSNPTSSAVPSTNPARTEQIWVEPPATQSDGSRDPRWTYWAQRRNRNLYKKRLEALEWLKEGNPQLCSIRDS